MHRPWVVCACLTLAALAPVRGETQRLMLSVCAPLAAVAVLPEASFLVWQQCPAPSESGVALPSVPPRPTPAVVPLPPSSDAPGSAPCAVTVTPVDPHVPLPVWTDRLRAACLTEGDCR